MPDAKRYRLRAGVTLPYADWIRPDAVYIGQPIHEPSPSSPASVQLFDPEDASISEVIPGHMLEELP